MLWLILHKRKVFVFNRATIINAVKILIASALMALVVCKMYQFLIMKVAILYSLAATVIVGGALFLGIAALLGAFKVGELLALTKRRKI